MAQREDVVAALAELESSGGRLTPDVVVETARDPASVLHGHFEWDDSAAAHQHRLDQARRLITSVYYEVRHSTIVLACPTYIRDPEAEARQQGYRRIAAIRTEAEAAHEALATEMARVRAVLARAKTLALVLGQSGMIEELDAQVEEFTRDLRAAREQAAAAEAAAEAAPEPEPMPPPSAPRRGRPKKGGAGARR